MDELNTIADGLNALLASYAEPCIDDCDHSQCPLLRDLHALQIRAALEKARLTVKPTVDRELQAEQIGDLMNMRLDLATPRATGETTVEAALAELREMFPGKAILIRREDSFYPPDCRDAADRNLMVTIKIGYLESEPKFRSFRSLADCIAQVRAATQTKAERGEG